MAVADFKPFFDWLNLHPHYSVLIAFAIAFAESFAVLGLAVPGTVFMTALGGLVGAGILPMWHIMIATMVGSFCGDTSSFWIGYRFQDDIKAWWPFSKHPRWLSKGETFFHRHGGKSIFLGRFIGPIRPFTPIIGGMLKMSIPRFIITDIFASLLWAPAYLFPGYMLGAASKSLPPEVALRIALWTLSILLGLWILFKMFNRIFWVTVKAIDEGFDRFWHRTNTVSYLKPFHRFLVDPFAPNAHKQLTLLCLFLITGILFVFVAANVIWHGPLLYLNEPIRHFFLISREMWINTSAVTITLFGQRQLLVVFVAVVFGYFLAERNVRTAFYWLFNAIFCWGSVFIIKHLIENPRPTGLIVSLHGFSFPSGHTTLATGLYLFAAILIGDACHRRYRYIPYLSAVALVFAVGLSRLYLGAHWLSDVLAGWLLGLSCALFTTILYRRGTRVKPYLARFVPVLLIALFSCVGYYGHKHMTELKHIYETKESYLQAHEARKAWIRRLLKKCCRYDATF